MSDNNPIGKCFLCGTSDVPLMRSHFLPKHVYRKINKGLIKEGHSKMLLHDGLSKEMTREITGDKFCGCCEGKLSANGENYFAENAMPSVNNVAPKLFKQLILKSPISKTDELLYITKAIDQSDEDKLLYFIVSMFWRGTLEWSNFIRYDLPPEIEREMKMFLNGDVDKITKFHITIDLPVENEQYSVFFPAKLKYSSHTRYLFSILSYAFNLIPFPNENGTIFYGRNFKIERDNKALFDHLYKTSKKIGNKPHDISWNN